VANTSSATRSNGRAQRIRPRRRPRGERTYVAPSTRHGRGVFAAERIGRGVEIERCPVLIVPGNRATALDRAGLRGYCYEWGRDLALALGHGSLYNHSFRPNAECEALLDEGVLVIRSRRVIEPGEEITLDYTGARNRKSLWFDAVD